VPFISNRLVKWNNKYNQKLGDAVKGLDSVWLRIETCEESDPKKTNECDGKWSDSETYKINLKKPTEPEPEPKPPSGKCTTIAECKAILDLEMIGGVFGESESYSDYKIFIDPGHGGSDSGASWNEIYEKNLNLQIAQKVYSKLQGKGFNVQLSRTTDAAVSIEARVQKAITFFNTSPKVPREKRIFIGVHHNAPSSSSSCVNPSGSLNSTWVLHRNDNVKSEAFSNVLINNLESNAVANSYRVCSESECSSYETLGVLRETANSPDGTDNVALIEYNFICFTSIITKSSWQERSAQATVDGIVEYISTQQSEPASGGSLAEAQSQFSCDPNNSVVYGKPCLQKSEYEKILVANSSKAVGYGDKFYELGLEYGVNPELALAFFRQESSMGNLGVALTTKSVGNIICDSSAGACPVNEYKPSSSRCFCSFTNWEQSIDHFYYYLVNSSIYLPGRKYTVEDIIPIYSPKEDGNNPEQAIANIKTSISEFRTNYETA